MLPSPKGLYVVFSGLVALIVPMWWLWGFTVDDAWITGRVAHQLATGHGYRFNPTGPVVDAVTPLGWAFVLMPFASSGPDAAVVAAKWLGALAWLAAAFWLCGRLARFQLRGSVLGILLIGTSIPLAAWAVAGMETGVVLALATIGLHESWGGRGALGVAAGLRPELLPWVFVVGSGRAWLREGSAIERVRRVALASAPLLAPFFIVAVLRTIIFGAAYPLAVLAKPSDASSGLRYALGALVFTSVFWTTLGLRSLLKLTPFARVLGAAALLHAWVLVMVGGDWMPLYRLFVPVLPSLILVGAELAQQAPVWATAVRTGFALFAALLLAVGRAQNARGVAIQRAALIEATRPLLANAKRVATLDVGWVGAATEAHVVDLAGVTDPTVARLAGGHTSKRLPESFLESRDVDALVLLADEAGTWPNLHFARAVEARIVTLAGAERFEFVAWVPLWGTRQAYAVARRVEGAPHAD
jgi:hypothetical protein